jgi:hypothetical protein
MNKIGTSILLILCITFSGITKAQKLNGQALSFPNGKSEWSDTVYKKLRTKKMAKEGINAVTLAVRYKVVKQENSQLWYDLEITNKSPETKVKFKVSYNHNQDSFTVKLDPKQTKVIERLNWVSRAKGMNVIDEEEYLVNPFEEILQNRD